MESALDFELGDLVYHTNDDQSDGVVLGVTYEQITVQWSQISWDGHMSPEGVATHAPEELITYKRF